MVRAYYVLLLQKPGKPEGPLTSLRPERCTIHYSTILLWYYSVKPYHPINLEDGPTFSVSGSAVMYLTAHAGNHKVLPETHTASGM